MSTFLLFGHARLSLGHVLNLCVHSCSIKSPNIIAILKTGKEDSIADKGPSINTEQGTISGDTVSTGNKDYIGAKGPSSIQTKVKCQVTKFQQEIKVLLLTNMFINTEQGKISGDKGSTGNKDYIAD